MLKLRLGAVLLAIASFNVLVLPFFLAQCPGMEFHEIVVIMVCGGLITLASVIWLVVLVIGLAKRVNLAREQKQSMILACLFFGQFGMVWSVFYLTRDSSFSESSEPC